MFRRKGLQGICVKCNRIVKVHNAKDLVIDKNKTSIEFDCVCGQHNVMHLQVVRRRINKQTPAVNAADIPQDIPNERSEITPFDNEND